MTWQGVLIYLGCVAFSFGLIPRLYFTGPREKMVLALMGPLLALLLCLNLVLGFLEWDKIDLTDLFEKSKDSRPLPPPPPPKPVNTKGYVKVFIFTVICVIPGLMPLVAQQGAPGLSGTLYDLGQFFSMFTFFALPCLSIYHLGHFIAYLRPKNADQSLVLLLGLLGCFLSVSGFLMTLASCRGRAGFP